MLGRGSSVVFISSAGARTARPGYAALGVGKALAEAVIRYLVPELAPLGIRINAAAPGLVHTTSVAKMTGSEEIGAEARAAGGCGAIPPAAPAATATTLRWSNTCSVLTPNSSRAR